MSNYMYCFKKYSLLLFFLFFIPYQVISSNENEEFHELNLFLDNLLIKNFMQDQSSNISSEYKYIRDIKDVNYFKKERIFLNYDGLKSGGMWSKPGAKNFGGERVATFYFNKGPVEAFVVAHKELPGNRNYFYILIDNESNDEGWVGRPYVMIDEEGKTFLMPNPVTGEMVREIIEFKFDITAIRRIMVEEPVYYQRYIPSYNKIPWYQCLCQSMEDFQEEGYQLYLNALEDGKRQVDTIVNNYLIFNTPN